jgi:hypothetical protein
MSIKNISAAETWDKVYYSFEKINFVSFDYESVKESLIQYMKLYYSEVFNDYIETSELIAIIDSFAVVAEQLAYRIDMASHENFISTAERKQNILKLAKLISYNSSRNLPGRGLVKLTSVSSTESIIDSQGNDLSNRTIIWNDSNNSLWKEQFFLVMNRMMARPFGQPTKTFQLGDVAFQLYSFNSPPSAFTNGVYGYSVTTNTETLPMEIVSSDLDADGVFEKTPDENSIMQFVYSSDGLGDGSDMTGFLMYTKQGTLMNIPLSFSAPIPNQIIDINLQNINNIDIWLNKVQSSGVTIERWTPVDTINAQNIYFNTDKNRNKFEVETLENDKVRLLFGDGNFATIPVGDFAIWVRQSANSNVIIQKNRVVNIPLGFGYTSQFDVVESAAFTFSLVGTLQNSSASEDIEHIRRKAPSTYYSQGRMVNGQDYNTLLLRDPSILKLKAVNRTFAGQTKYLDWNDASGAYQNIKVFGDDLRVYFDSSIGSVISTNSSRTLIDTVIEPLLKSSNILNILTLMSAQNIQFREVCTNPRYKFIENKNLKIQEKTSIQGKLDRHWYGEQSQNITLSGVPHALVSADSDYKIYNDTIPRTIDGIGSYSGGIPSGLQPESEQPTFGLGFTSEIGMVGDGAISQVTVLRNTVDETWTVEFINDASGATMFSVVGSVSGFTGFAQVGANVPYSNDSISFSIAVGSTPFIIGDSFVIDVKNGVASLRTFFFNNIPYQGANLNGKWYVISGDLLDKTSGYNPSYRGTYSDSSWIFIINRHDSSSGQVIEWEITYRDLKTVAESNTTKFWYNSDSYIIDGNSKNRVRDRISLLKSNLNKNRTLAIGVNKNLDVIEAVKHDNGVVNINALEVLPTDSSGVYQSGDGVPDSSMMLTQFINTGVVYTFNQYIASSTWTIKHGLGTLFPVVDYIDVDNALIHTLKIVDDNSIVITFADSHGNPVGIIGRVSVSNYDAVDYVYFKASDPTDPNQVETPLASTPLLRNMFAIGKFVSNDGVYDLNGAYIDYTYIRKIGRDGLDFLWQHFTPDTNLIDPSTSNIIDMFVLTRGYFDNVSSFIARTNSYTPVQPTPLELRNSYSRLLSTKMISDTVVMHSGTIKLLFGDLSSPQLRARFRVIKSLGSTLTDDQIKAEIVKVINIFFTVDNWDFGDTFYATELFSLIHQRLPSDVASVVLVPLFANNSFGSMFVVDSGENEILQSSATISDVEIVNTYTATTLRQNLN